MASASDGKRRGEVKGKFRKTVAAQQAYKLLHRQAHRKTRRNRVAIPYCLLMKPGTVLLYAGSINTTSTLCTK